MTAKMTKKEIKNFITRGIAIDITSNSFEANNALRESCHLETIAISVGVYGMTGALLRDRKSGQLYAITARNTTLFQMV